MFLYFLVDESTKWWNPIIFVSNYPCNGIFGKRNHIIHVPCYSLRFDIFQPLMAVIMNIPICISTVVLLSIVILLSRRLQDICYVAATSNALLSLLGIVLLLVLPIGPVQLLGLILAEMFGTSFTLLQALISSNVSGYTKKIFYTGASMVAYCIGCFTGPLLMLEKEAPRYVGAMVTYAIADVVAGLSFVFIRVTLSRENKRRQELKIKGMIPPPPSNRNELDLTDKEDLNFIYRP